MYGTAWRRIVSIHAPARGATGRKDLVPAELMFQSTLPREERLQSYDLTNISTGFQSTLPREERPTVQYKYRANDGVSIHAPARGATFV